MGYSMFTRSFFFRGNALCSRVCGAYFDDFLTRRTHRYQSWDIPSVISSNQLKPTCPSLQWQPEHFKYLL